MRLTKPQGIVITLLNIVIVALVAVIMFVPTGDAPADVPASGDPVIPPADDPVHDKLRPAAKGRTDAISYEARLMGLGDESVIASYITGRGVYVFGNASVKGLDFDCYGGFVCRLDTLLDTLAFSYFDGDVTAVCAFGDLFIAAAGEKLYTVDAECKINCVVQKTDGRVEDVFPVDNGTVAVVTQPSSTSLKLTEYSAADTFGKGRSTRIDSGYTLKYFDCYIFSDSYVMAARAHSLPRYDSFVLYSFSAGGDAVDHNYGGTGDAVTCPYAVMPCADGYIALAAKNGVATVIDINYSFTVYRAQSLGFTVTDGSLIYADNSYYATFSGALGAVTYRIDGEKNRTRVASLDGIEVCASRGGAFIGTSAQKKTAVNIAAPDGEIRTLDISGADINGFYDADGMTLVVLSATGGADISPPSAGRDIYLLLLKNV